MEGAGVAMKGRSTGGEGNQEREAKRDESCREESKGREGGGSISEGGYERQDREQLTLSKEQSTISEVQSTVFK